MFLAANQTKLINLLSDFTWPEYQIRLTYLNTTSIGKKVKEKKLHIQRRKNINGLLIIACFWFSLSVMIRIVESFLFFNIFYLKNMITFAKRRSPKSLFGKLCEICSRVVKDDKCQR